VTGGLAKCPTLVGREELATARLAPMSTPSTIMAGRAPRFACLNICSGFRLEAPDFWSGV
jgi:hypothetical protein